MEHYHPEEHRSHFTAHVCLQPIHWLSAIGMMLMSVILILLNISLSHSIAKFRQKDQDHHVSKSVLCPAFTTISFAATSVSCLITTILIIISSDFYHQTIVDDIFTKMSISLYTLSQTLMIYSFVTRIDGAFRGSAVQYPKIFIRSLYCTSIIFVIFCLFVIVALAFEEMILFAVLLLIWMLLFLCLSTILCILFIRKANLLLQSVDNNVDKDFLYVVIKQSLLVPIAICTSFTCYIVVSLVQYFSGSTEWIPAAIFWIVVDCTVSSIGIFLLFSWNNHIYDKYCRLLHHFCEKNKLSQMELDVKPMPDTSEPNINNRVIISNEPSYIAKTKDYSTKTINANSSGNKQFISNVNQQISIKPKLNVAKSLKRVISKDKNAFTETLMDVPAFDGSAKSAPSHMSSFTGSKIPKIQSTKSSIHIV